MMPRNCEISEGRYVDHLLSKQSHMASATNSGGVIHSTGTEMPDSSLIIASHDDTKPSYLITVI